jgi:hypothetical protein
MKQFDKKEHCNSIKSAYMNEILNYIKSEVYNKCGFAITNYQAELEGKEYDSCKFELNGSIVILSRTAKITPTKIGQFVTLWKRDNSRITTPHSISDEFDFVTINVKNGADFGQFVFPKSALANHGIVANENHKGKRGFRVYPSWTAPNNRQASATQKWQLKCFYDISSDTNLESVKRLYSTK